MNTLAHAVLVDIHIADIDPDPANERTADDLSAEALAELKASIREIGVLQPIQVYQVGYRYRVFDGHRRTAAARLAGLKEIPAVVHHEKPPQNEQLTRQRITANLHRADMNPIRLARSLKALVEDNGYTQAEVAADFGKSQPWLANLASLLDLPETVITLLEAGQLSASHGGALRRIKDPELDYSGPTGRTAAQVQEELAQRAIEKHWSVDRLIEQIDFHLSYQRNYAEHIQREAERKAAASTEEGQAAAAKKEAEREKESQAQERASARQKQRRDVARQAVKDAMDPIGGLDSLTLLKFLGLQLYSNWQISNAAGAPLLKAIQEATDLATLINLLAGAAYLIPDISYETQQLVTSWSGATKFALETWNLNTRIAVALDDAGLLTPKERKELLPNAPPKPKAKNKKRKETEVDVEWYCVPGDHHYNAPAAGVEECPHCGANVEQFTDDEWADLLAKDEDEEDATEGDEDAGQLSPGPGPAAG